jgi:2-C-methyl-D-erythritol 4-phosphate cytidylyltransferase
MTSTVGAIIVASGEALRMRGIDKIFAPLLGWPLVAHSVAAFSGSAAIQRIVLVVSSRNVSAGRSLVEERDWSKVAEVCAGGERRQDSVRAGLDRLQDVEWVVVHDGARPLVDTDMIDRGLDAARETGSAVAAVPVSDTIKVADEDLRVTRTLPRSHLWAAQTPQVFRRTILAEAHDGVAEDVTDDAAMVEKLGGKVKLFTGSSENIKVTTPVDLTIAEALLAARHGDTRE